MLERRRWKKGTQRLQWGGSLRLPVGRRNDTTTPNAGSWSSFFSKT